MKDDNLIATLPKAVLLDWDGTLVDSYDFLKAAHNHVRGFYGYELWDDAAFKDVMRRSTREAFADLYGEKAEEIKDRLIAYVDENYVHSIVIMDGANELLEILDKANILVGIVSNKRHERLVMDIQELGWDKYLKVIVGAGEAERDKPAPDPIYLALERLNMRPDECTVWYVGDTATDLESANAAGVASVLMLHGVGGPELVEQYNVSYVFNDLKSLHNAIEGKISANDTGKKVCL